MNKLKALPFFFLLLLFWSSAALAYVQVKGGNGRVVKWQNLSSKRINVITANTQGISSSRVMELVNAAAATWNATSSVKIIPVQVSASVTGENNFYFSTDSSSMGYAVLGITQISYDYSGGIAGADIIINDNFDFETTNTSSDEYLGNVITHEMGHFLGLSHSEVKDSTMIYTALRGQHTLAHDDEAGIESLYSTGAKGTISGTIVGGNDLIGILGAHVQAISRSSGKVYAGVYSDADGSFSIKGLALDDSYYLYVSPADMLAEVSEYYSEAKKNFCSSSTNYRGDFFQSCQSSAEGLPQEIPLRSSSPSVSVGNVTIRCNLAAPQDYLNLKPFATNDYYNLAEGGAMTGFFTAGELSQGKKDVFRVDLSSHAVSGNEFLEIKTLSQGLYSRLLFYVTVKFLDGSSRSYSSAPQVDSDGNMSGDRVLRVPLDATSSNNVFEITMTPIVPNILSKWSISGTDYSLIDLFPNYSVKNEDLRFYLLVYNVTRLSAGNYSPLNVASLSSLSDNSSCPDAPRTYKVQASTDSPAATPAARKEKVEKSPIACGSIETKGGGSGPSGPLMLLLGMGLSLGLRFLLSTKRPWIPARPIS